MITFQNIESHISSLGSPMSAKTLSALWGGFLVIEEHQAQQFSDQFFSGLDVNTQNWRQAQSQDINCTAGSDCPGSTTTAVQKSGVCIKAA